MEFGHPEIQDCRFQLMNIKVRVEQLSYFDTHDDRQDEIHGLP
jgi:hypothetical protein